MGWKGASQRLGVMILEVGCLWIRVLLSWSHTDFLHVSETLTLIMAVGGKPNLKPI